MLARLQGRVGLRLAAVALLLGALGLRVWGIGFSPGSPYGRPDEEIFVENALGYFGSFDPLPTLSSGWPLGFFHLVHLLERLEVGALEAWFRSPIHLGCLYLIRPIAVELAPRMFSALAGTLACLFVGLIARRLVPAPRQGAAFLFGVAALGVNYLVARDAHFGVSDATLLLGVTLCLYFATRALLDDPRWLLAAAIAAGAAFGIKYAAAPLVLPCAMAGLGCFFRHRQRRLTVALVCAASPVAAFAAFAAVSPEAWTHLHAAIVGLKSHQDRFSASAVAGFILDPEARDLPQGWLFHLTVTLPAAFGLVGFAAALVGLATCPGERWVVATLWASALAFFGAVAPIHALFVRYASPLVAPLAVGLAVASSWIWERARHFRLRGRSGALGLGACGAILALAFVPPLQTLVAFDRLLASPDTRELAADWVVAQGPGATLVTQGLYGEIHGLEVSAWDACAPLVPASLLRKVPELPGQHADWQRLVSGDSSHWANLVHEGIRRYVAGASPPVRDARFVAQGHLVLDCGRPGKSDGQPLDPACFTAVAEFSPGAPACRDKVDIFDCFYMPYAAFEGVERPGPALVVSRNNCLP